VAEEIGAERSGLRISPGNPYNDIVEHDTHEVYPALVEALAPLGLAYLHVMHGGDEALLRELREAWPTALVLNRAGADPATFYGGDHRGYTDYPTLATVASGAA
jgi:N-ethylmaleimide reductase